MSTETLAPPRFGTRGMPMIAGRIGRGRTVVEHRTASDHPLASPRRGLPVEGTHRDWRPAMYSSVNGRTRRRLPPVSVRREILASQLGNCAYCTLPVEARIYRKSRPVQLRLVWDHFVPYSYLQRNPQGNWRAACHVCNGLKSDLRFDSDEDACLVVARMRDECGYESSSVAWKRLLSEPYNEYTPPEETR